MFMVNKYNIISYGGGTQSTYMTIKLLNSIPKPDFGVYSDTGWEPQNVNEYVNMFIKHCKDEYNFDIYKIENIIPERSQAIPLFTENGGMLMRRCTGKYKIKPLEKLINSLIGRNKYNLFIGISFEERSRMKLSPNKKRTNLYPLVERYIRRSDSIQAITEYGLPKPYRSSCIMCPYHSNKYWNNLKLNNNQDWLKAIKYDDSIRNLYDRFDSYIHRSLIPLSEVNTDPYKDQLSIFPELIDECDGYCGI